MPDTPHTPPGRVTLLLALGLAALTVLAHGGSLGNGFFGLDDALYVSENPAVLGGFTGRGVQWAFTLNTNTYWHPLTWLSLMLDAQVFGPTAWGFHLTNLVLHAANVVLFFCLLQLASGRVWPSAAAAALFAVHPIHVEAVAWVTARKDVLSGFFFLSSALAYVLWAAHGRAGLRWMSVLAYVLAILAKPVALTLPFALLLFDAWPLRRLDPTHLGQASRLLREKIPYFAILPLVLLVVLVSHPLTSTTGEAGNITLALRLANLPLAYAAYLKKFFWPADLAMFYSFPIAIPAWKPLAALILLAGMSTWALVGLRTRPALAVGWFFFLGTMLPMIGLVQAGLWPAMADRYAYLPFLGLYTALAFGLADLAGRRLPRAALALPLVGVLAVLMPATRAQTRLWDDTVALFRQTTTNVPDNWMGHLLLGSQLAKMNRLAEAEGELRRTLAINPRYSATYSWLGVVLQRQGRKQEALPFLEKAAHMRTDSAAAWNNLGVLLAQLGRLDEAVAALERAEKLDPDAPHIRTGLEKVRKMLRESAPAQP